MSAADGAGLVDAEADNTESVKFCKMSCTAAIVSPSPTCSAASASLTSLRKAFVNEDLEIFHRQTWLLHRRCSLLIQTRMGLIIAFGTKSAVFGSKHRLRLHMACCQRFAEV